MPKSSFLHAKFMENLKTLKFHEKLMSNSNMVHMPKIGVFSQKWPKMGHFHVVQKHLFSTFFITFDEK